MMIQESFPLYMTVTATISGSSEEEINSQIEYYKEMFPTATLVRPPTDLGGALWEAKLERNVCSG
jgi:hypothetical protein